MLPQPLNPPDHDSPSARDVLLRAVTEHATANGLADTSLMVQLNAFVGDLIMVGPEKKSRGVVDGLGGN